MANQQAQSFYSNRMRKWGRSGQTQALRDASQQAKRQQFYLRTPMRLAARALVVVQIGPTPL